MNDDAIRKELAAMNRDIAALYSTMRKISDLLYEQWKAEDEKRPARNQGKTAIDAARQHRQDINISVGP